MSKRVIFHDLVTLEQASEILLKFAKPLGEEEVDIVASYGRVLARDVVAPIDVPPFDRSTVDGFAVVAASTYGASELTPVELRLVGRVEAGGWPQGEVKAGEAYEVATGAPIPRGADSVVMVEYTQERDGVVRIFRPVAPGENLMSAGSDISAGEVVLRRCTRLTAREIGVLAALGMRKVRVIKRPKVGIISTGDELTPPGKPLGPGKLYDVNTYTLIAAVAEAGGEPIPYGIVEDVEESYRAAIAKALSETDVVLISGGTSAGVADLTYRVLGELGDVLFHGVMVKPGKPTLAAVVNGKIVVGLPGYPSSALMIFHTIVRPFLLRLQCLEPMPPAVYKARLAYGIEGAKGRRALYPVVLIARRSEYRAYPLYAESGAISVLARADGYIIVPENVEFMSEGEEVYVYLFEKYKPSDLYFIGSHDPHLDAVLARHNVKTVYVGSLGGLMALKRGEADMAGAHIYDPETNAYNVPYVKKLRITNVAVVGLYKREQGLIVKRGNPKGIRGVEDLLRGDVVYVNRPRGTGTRALLDLLLSELAEKMGTTLESLAKKIRGYTYEVKTHTAVAAAVAQGRADVGLGVRYAAELYGLDFIPIGWEEYDIVVRKSVLDKAMEIVEEALENLPPGYQPYEHSRKIKFEN
ncbi:MULTISPECIES: molybdopterin biosynthesis protein [Pyrobaculum]|uniref:molybdopterin molybdotransferase n=2 Tax=Pyrobaculum arsenaticum TaxID=121277 RepID=A4WLZ3_PYRAR|nr:molybdopterin biosynthesis protein [Pyrobaculum arsenaticum]ABP51410.1 molybdopterin molybdochelatase [Pyrobaculum arsenaticum DSM 13514]MCY0889944.1 molybdopterin biosynthesis protein [Pyrobaculum arsenaticum]NYR16220.1 molybdopterin biosynthesis protein [Pyrobaculum arsenaticum]